MSTYTATALPVGNLINQTANWQAFITAIHAAIAAAGWTQSAATGQIVDGTSTPPATGVAASGVAAGYEIWHLADANEGAAPIFMKIEYGFAADPYSNATVQPCLWITTGSGSNGTGTLTGEVTARTPISYMSANSGANATTDTANLYCCGDSSGFWLGLTATLAYNGGTTAAMLIIIDRTRDGGGNATADGYLVHMSGYRAQVTAGGGFYSLQVATPAMVSSQLMLVATTTFTTEYFSSPQTWLAYLGLAQVGANLPVFPFKYPIGKMMYSKIAHIVPSNYATNLVSFAASVFGGTHTLLPWNQYGMNYAGGYVPGPAGYPGDYYALLWE